MKKYKRSDYAKSLSDALHVIRNEQKIYRDAIENAYDDDDVRYNTERLHESKIAFKYIHWQLMLINPD